MARSHGYPALVLLLLGAALACTAEEVRLTDTLGDPAYPDDYWSASTAEAEGMDGARLAEGLRHVEEHGLHLEAFLVARHGRLVLEQYGRGYSPLDLHAEYSTTKTFTGMLVGLALSEGSIPSLQSRVLDWFGADVVEGASNPDKARMTVEDLLTMRSGLAYDEGATDYVFTADRPAVTILSLTQRSAPGTTWSYSSADAHVAAEVLRRATGQTPLEYARARLFGPLGISELRWEADPTGTSYGSGGLWLRPRDLARFGQLLLARGAWKGEQLLPAHWIEASTAVHATTAAMGGGYGYLCWIPRIGGYAARGFAGQDLYVFPDRDLVVVFNAALPWAAADATLDELVRRFVLPAVRD